MRTLMALCTGAFAVLASFTFAAEPVDPARLAISTDSATAHHAREVLRAQGPSGLEALLTTYADEIARHADGQDVANWGSIAAAIDAVAMQRDAWASGLYWYTDLDEAKAVAVRERKPILSLRLLGTLDAELSCANSRFFRTTLYPAEGVSRRMRENFVLHWSSERPVPVVTVDFGDGRTLKRTITGNSAHYLMTPDGQVVDVLPGLYGAQPFARWLDEAGALARQSEELPAHQRQTVVQRHHEAKQRELETRWAMDFSRAGAANTNSSRASDRTRKTSAKAAARVAIGKSAVESPIVEELSVESPTAAGDETWAKIAALHAEDAALDPAVARLIRAKQPKPALADAVEAGERAMAKAAVESPLARIFRALQRSIAEDTVRNEYLLHAKIHEWFARGVAPRSFEKLNERVYADLFLTPRSDPWLGLAPEDAWSALDGDGLATASSGASP